MNFKIFKTDNGECIINLDNVTDIQPSKDINHTEFYVLSAPNGFINVNESYECVKGKIFPITYHSGMSEIDYDI